MNKSINHLVRINGDNASPEAQQALQRIAENLAARGTDLQANEFNLAQELEVLTRLSALEVHSQVQPSRIPIIGGLVTRLKQALHQLVLFYVRDLAAQQNAFNAQTLHVLNWTLSNKGGKAEAR
jgi:hypothetical protein